MVLLFIRSLLVVDSVNIIISSLYFFRDSACRWGFVLNSVHDQVFSNPIQFLVVHSQVGSRWLIRMMAALKDIWILPLWTKREKIVLKSEVHVAQRSAFPVRILRLVHYKKHKQLLNVGNCWTSWLCAIILISTQTCQMTFLTLKRRSIHIYSRFKK